MNQKTIIIPWDDENYRLWIEQIRIPVTKALRHEGTKLDVSEAAILSDTVAITKERIFMINN